MVENGLFIDICDKVVIGHGDGRVELRDINEGTDAELDQLGEFGTKENLFSDSGGLRSEAGVAGPNRYAEQKPSKGFSAGQ